MPESLNAALFAFMLWQNQSVASPKIEPMSLMGQVDLQVIFSTYQHQCMSLRAISPAVQPEMDPEEKAYLDFQNQTWKKLQQMKERVEAGELTEEEFLTRQRVLEDEARKRYQQEQKRLGEKQKALLESIKLQKERHERNLLESVEQVAQKYGLKLVVRKQTMLIPSLLGPPNVSEYALSGRDITQDVLALMTQKGWCKNP